KLNDAVETVSNIDLSSYEGMDFVVNIINSDDTVDLGGSENNVVVNLMGSDDTVNIDDSSYNTFEIIGGSASSTVNMSGDLSDYTLIDNNNGSFSILNNTSLATTTIDINLGSVVFADGLQLTVGATGMIITDTAGNDSNIDLTSYNVSSFIVNAGDNNDVINLGGEGNDFVVNLDSGDNTVNIDDSIFSDYDINGGTGIDTVNLSGTFSDYSIVDYHDGTYILNNTLTGARITLDTSIENVVFSDGLQFSYDGEVYTLTDSSGNDANIDLSGFYLSTFVVNTGDGNDTVELGGSSNDVTVNLNSGDNVVNIDGLAQGTYVINGGTGVDTINIDGNFDSYSLIDNGDGTYTLSNNAFPSSITVDTYVDSIVFDNGSQLSFNGDTFIYTDASLNSMNLDTTDYSNVNLVINAGDNSDLIDLGGSDNNITVNLDSGSNIVNVDGAADNNFIINGGTGDDTVNLMGSIEDYRFSVDDGILTIDSAMAAIQSTVTIDNNVDNVIFSDGSMLTFDGTTVNLTDVSGNSLDMSLVSYRDTSITIDAQDGDDYIDLGGVGNNISVDLGSGNDKVNIDDSLSNTFNIVGNDGTDSIVLAGNFSDYTISTDPFGLVVLSNNVSGATTTIDSTVENIYFGDDIALSYDGEVLTYTDFVGSSSTIDFTDFNVSNLSINSGDGNDVIDIGGEGNEISVNLDSGDNIVNVDDSLFNTIKINGGIGDDTVNMSGSFSDYEIVTNPDGTYYLSNSTSGSIISFDSSVDTVSFSDGLSLSFDGDTFVLADSTSSNSIDLSDYDHINMTINTTEGDDEITLGGSLSTFTVNLTTGDNTVYVDDTEGSDFTINGGVTVAGVDGSDTVYLSGNFADYSLLASGSTLSFSNNISESTVTIDNNVDSVVFADGSVMQYISAIEPGAFTAVFTDALGNQSTIDLSSYSDSSFIINASDMNDTVVLGGTNNDVTVNLDSGDNIVNVDTSSINNFDINGGTGDDTVSISSSIEDYIIVNNGDNTLTLVDTTSEATVTIDNNIENINFTDTELTFADLLALAGGGAA
ncbi:MAG: beta strand repeat-containing protein, partial [Vampirovibrionia bacterium]